MNRALLEQAFPPEQVKQRDGSFGFGKKLNYIEGHAVIQRLNDAFEHNWSFEILSHEIQGDSVIVLGKLSAEGIIKNSFGSSKITKVRETGAVLSIADDLKSASTDSLKKCATLLGVGLHLYQDKSTGQQNDNNNPATSNVIPMNNPAQGNGTTRLTAKQHSYIQRLANEQGLTKKELNSRCREVYGVVSDHLSKDQASSCIEQMLA
jgi:hypothetical protein